MSARPSEGCEGRNDRNFRPREAATKQACCRSLDTRSHFTQDRLGGALEKLSSLVSLGNGQKCGGTGTW